jgi:hypothetical protein
MASSCFTALASILDESKVRKQLRQNVHGLTAQTADVASRLDSYIRSLRIPRKNRRERWPGLVEAATRLEVSERTLRAILGGERDRIRGDVVERLERELGPLT